MFPPELDTEIKIRSMSFKMAEHPLFQGVPFGQEGREGTVYKLIGEDGQFSALKVFRPAFRYPSIVKHARKISDFSSISGLSACYREVLNPKEDMDIISAYPELLYAALMPWIEGETWTEILVSKEVLSRKHSLELALAFVSRLVEMEQAGIAHTDLSASNIILLNADMESESWSMEFVDMEGLYAKQLKEPDNLPEGATGYTASFLREYPDWSTLSDRFSGGILLAEMLGWSSKEICEAAWGESYFEPLEIQQDCDRYGALTRILEEQYGPVISVFLNRLWNAEQLQQCPAFGEWQVALTSIVEQDNDSPNEETMKEDTDPAEFMEEHQERYQGWFEDLLTPDQEKHLQRARQIEKQGDFRSALWEYGTLVETLPVGSAFRVEIEIAMEAVQQAIDAEISDVESSSKPVKQLLNRAVVQGDQSLYQKLWFIVLLGSGVVLALALLLYVIGILV